MIIYALQADWVISFHRPPDEWPDQGRIEIERFDLRYREQLPLVLKDISCAIGAKEKVRVVWPPVHLECFQSDASFLIPRLC